ncbi:MAG: SAM-dependent methyltransferase [Bacteroidales bacterium]|nr:SAM-dependent methyltransferase [Bacteroidales bacterium]
MNGKLYLIPTLLGEDESVIDWVIPLNVKNVVNQISHYIVENERTARRYLLKIGYKTPIDSTCFYVLNKHTKDEEIAEFLKPALEGMHLGLLSEAGVPCVADPGNIIVRLAHLRNILVEPLTGPSSIILALMASGFNGQNFSFLGYLPIDKAERIRKIKHLEALSLKENQTQIFIETPFRNQKLFEDIVNNCNPATLLCLACNISLPYALIKTKTISEWKKSNPDLNKKPTAFLIYRDK